MNPINLKGLAQAAYDDGETMEQWRSMLPSHLIYLSQQGKVLEKTISDYVAEAASYWPSANDDSD
jgi:hypothetical protein